MVSCGLVMTLLSKKLGLFKAYIIGEANEASGNFRTFGRYFEKAGFSNDWVVDGHREVDQLFGWDYKAGVSGIALRADLYRWKGLCIMILCYKAELSYCQMYDWPL